jgi:hypothetical protein
MNSFPRVVLPVGLLVLGLVGCSYGGLILASIPRSDTDTGELIVFGLEFAVPGLALAGLGAWLLRRLIERGA